MSHTPEVIESGGSIGAVVAVKALDRAKSRILADPSYRRELTWVMLLDTVTSLSRAVDALVVVGEELPASINLCSKEVDVVEDPGGDLNAAFAVGAATLIKAGHTSIIASVADLPTLRTSSVHELIAASPRVPRLYLTDATGTGTTMVLTRGLQPGQEIATHFEGNSALAHRRSRALDPAPGQWPDARLDVDTLDDLERARQFGLGPHTRAFLSERGWPLGERSLGDQARPA